MPDKRDIFSSYDLGPRSDIHRSGSAPAGDSGNSTPKGNAQEQLDHALRRSLRIAEKQQRTARGVLSDSTIRYSIPREDSGSTDLEDEVEGGAVRGPPIHISTQPTAPFDDRETTEQLTEFQNLPSTSKGSRPPVKIEDYKEALQENQHHTGYSINMFPTMGRPSLSPNNPFARECHTGRLPIRADSGRPRLHQDVNRYRERSASRKRISRLPSPPPRRRMARGDESPLNDSSSDSSSDSEDDRDSDDHSQVMANVTSTPSMSEIQTAFKVIPRFQGYKSRNPKQWLQRFEEFAAMNGWSDTAKCYMMSLLLHGAASNWFSQLPQRTKRDFTKVKRSFLATYGVDEAARLAHDVEFSSLRQEENQRVEDYIEMMISRASELNKSDDEIKDAILRGLQPQIQAYVLSKGPKSLNGVVSAAKVAMKLYPQSAAQEMQKILKTLEEIKCQNKSESLKEKEVKSSTVAKLRQEYEGQISACEKALQNLTLQQEQSAYQMQLMSAKLEAQTQAALQSQVPMQPFPVSQNSQWYASNAAMKNALMEQEGQEIPAYVPPPVRPRPNFAGFRPQNQFTGLDRGANNSGQYGRPSFGRQFARPAGSQRESSSYSGPPMRSDGRDARPTGPRTGGMESGTCFGCGGPHARSFCPFRNSICFYCQQPGHIVRVCKRAAQNGVNPNNTSFKRVSFASDAPNQQARPTVAPNRQQ